MKITFEFENDDHTITLTSPSVRVAYALSSDMAAIALTDGTYTAYISPSAIEIYKGNASSPVARWELKKEEEQ